MKTIEMRSLNGTLIYEDLNLRSSTTRIELPEITNGLYIVRITTQDGKIHHHKMMKN